MPHAFRRFLISLPFLAALFAGPPAWALPPAPKLLLIIVIDQFRADYPLRFEKKFLPASGPGGAVGGFRYLMERGAYFPMAQYDLLQSMTCPGHATILTGSFPYQNGIGLNFWNDGATGQGVYCAEDARYSVVGGPTGEHVGTSPKHLIGTTVGDELKNAGYPSKTVAISLKDRSAIMLGGHRADLAIWYNSKAQAWVSSQFYLPDGQLPAWLEKHNARTKKLDPAHVYEALAKPYGLEILADAAERAFDAIAPGRGSGTDVFAVSFSSHDYAGHAVGPNHDDMEKMTLAEDRLISRLLNHVRARTPGGLKNVVIALTGDHGIPPAPKYASEHRLDAGIISEQKTSEEMERRLNEKFGRPSSPWIAYNHDFNVYLRRAALADRKVAVEDALQEIKPYLAGLPGIAHVITAGEIRRHEVPPAMHGRQLAHSYYAGRSGDIILVPKPFYMISNGEDGVTHLTGYAYDRMVPLMLAGPGLRKGVYPQHVQVVDLAPTLSFLSHILPPSLSEGRVLTEALAAPGAER